MEGTAVTLAHDLDSRFSEITDVMRNDLEQLNRLIDEFRHSFQSLASSTRPSDTAATQLLHDSRARLQKLELAAAHIASSLAYVAGLGTAPGEQDETREISARVLEGIEHERQRLYREVHDGPAQVLTNAIFEV